MPTDYTTLRLERRLEKAAKDFVATVPALAALVSRERDDDAAITPQDETAKKARLIFVAKDTGRVMKTAIRSLQLSISVRANIKTADGGADAFDAICAALEQLLDGSNLVQSLTSVTYGINVMLAVRTSGQSTEKSELIRTEGYQIDVKAVPAEMTAA
jgi:hypothetical protein